MKPSDRAIAEAFWRMCDEPFPVPCNPRHVFDRIELLARELDRTTTLDAGDRCSACDGTGSVHRADGEYCGECSFCKPAPAGDAVAGLVEAARSIFDETVEDDVFRTMSSDEWACNVADRYTYQPTLRAAIDAAMKEEDRAR
jgi:hypothetical protein